MSWITLVATQHEHDEVQMHVSCCIHLSMDHHARGAVKAGC